MWDPNLVLLVIAVVNAFTAYMAWRTHRAMLANSQNIQKIELATNSMKDALVKATGESAHAAGLAEGKRFGEDLAASKAKGVVEANKER